jgi:hypothetical protein
MEQTEDEIEEMIAKLEVCQERRAWRNRLFDLEGE